MNNIFIENPIVVNILNRTSFDNNKFTKNISKQIVWINTKDPKILKLWNSRDHKQIRKKYKNIKNIKGGDEDVDNLSDFEIDEEDITFDDEELESLFKEDIDDESKIVESDKPVVEKPFSVVTNIFIFPEDKISDFKKKIFAETNIPPYRQHLFYEYQGKAFPLSYSISHEFTEKIDIRQIGTNKTLFEGLPVEPSWYANKDLLQVNALDEFYLLEHIYYKHGVTEFFVVDLESFIYPIRGNLELLLKSDMYSIELIYYSFIVRYWPQLTLSVFGDYIKNEKLLQDRFPELAPTITYTKDIYRKETDIIGSNYVPKLDPKKWDVPIYFSITHSTVSIPEQFVPPGSIINLRNLFDLFELNDTTNFIICNTEIEGRPVNLVKTYSQYAAGVHKTPNSVLINVNIKDQGNIQIVINKRGTYKVLTKFREDQHVTFDMIYNQINNNVSTIIDKINSFGRFAVSQNLVQLKNDNSVFTDIGFSIFWKFNINKKKFDNVKELLDAYVDANIITNAHTTSPTTHEYYFIKGMHKYELMRYKLMNPVQNQYQYLSDSVAMSKHNLLITRRKKMSITNRFSDIKIEISGIKEQEYITIYMYILRFFESIPRERGDLSTTNTKKLKQLKEQDPLLYEFKKVYDSDLVYSKLCQQQKQPIIHGEPGKNRVKFWNFTSDEPAYYECPNKKYPHINFIVNTHPKNFCIPCCYKLPPSTHTQDKKGKIFNTCMKHRTYKEEKKSLTTSRYVMSYGKDIEVGRLSRLPEHTLEPLFYDTFSQDVVGIDKECVKNKGYYLFGVPQHINNVSFVGFLFAASHALGKDIIDFVSLSLSKIKHQHGSWATLMQGKILQHFNTYESFEKELTEVFIGDKLSHFENWNQLFIEITTRFWGVSVVHFYDTSTPGEQSGISLKIPGYIEHIESFKSNNKHLIVIEKERSFYPIYVIYKDVFFTVGSVNKKLFLPDSAVIQVINNLALYQLNDISKNNSINLYLIKKFVRNSKYNIEKLFVNGSNFCYGVLIKYIHEKKVEPFYNCKDSKTCLDNQSYDELVDLFIKQNKQSTSASFYVPVKESYHKSDGTPILFNTPEKKYLTTWKTMNVFIQALNTYIKKYSQHKMKHTFYKDMLLFPIITPNSWIIYKNSVIGFKSINLHFLMKNMDLKEAQKIKPLKYTELMYDPFVVNKALSDNIAPAKDTRAVNISKSLYNNYLYPILILEFINVLNKQRNTYIRNKLKDIINSITPVNLYTVEVQKLLRDYPADLNAIRKIMVSIVFNKDKKSDIFMSKKPFTKKHAQDLIDKSIFDFDKKLLDKLKTMEYKELLSELKSIFDKLTINKNPNINDEFPNMIMSCEINHPYCKNKKLMIEKNTLHDILEIMAADILNPFKNRYIFSPIFVKNIVDNFKFIIRDNEYITITM